MSLMQSQMDQIEMDQTTKDLLFLKVTFLKGNIRYKTIFLQ